MGHGPNSKHTASIKPSLAALRCISDRKTDIPWKIARFRSTPLNTQDQSTETLVMARYIYFDPGEPVILESPEQRPPEFIEERKGQKA